MIPINHQEMTTLTPETIVRERLDFVVKQIFQFTVPEIKSDSILWRDARGLQKVELSNGFTIGRDASSNIPLEDNFSSRTHVKFTKDADEWVVIDQGSRNGTWVNNHPVDASSLHSGDLIRVGNTYFVYIGTSCDDIDPNTDLSEAE